MRREDLFRDLEITGECGSGEFSGIRSDSRRVKPGELFLALPGTRRDGHDFALDALSRGAAAVIGEHPIPGVPGEKMLIVPDSRRAESILWNNFTGRPADGMKKIAVTGTAGKTTVTMLAALMLKTAGIPAGFIATGMAEAAGAAVSLGGNGGSSVGDIPGAMTTPDPEYFFGAVSEMKRAGCRVLLYEASSQAIALGKLSSLTPDLAAFTNLSPEHLDFHGTLEAYFRAKASLLSGVPRALINGGDPWLARLPGLFPETDFTLLTTEEESFGPPALSNIREIVRAAEITRTGEGSEFERISPHAAFRMRTPMPGQFSVMNVLLAAQIALACGADPGAVRDAASVFRGPPGRLSRVRTDGSREEETQGGKLPAVYIDYAHTPEELRAVLTALSGSGRGPLTVVFGCGGDRDRSKRPKMAAIALALADRVIITSDNPRTEDPRLIFRDILSGIGGRSPWTLIPDRERAVRHAILSSPRNGIVLLAGKGHEKYEIDAEGKHPFDEEAIARQALVEYERRGRE